MAPAPGSRLICLTSGRPVLGGRALRTVGAYEAKTHLFQLIEEVTRGERVAITKNGTPATLLVPVPSAQQPDPREVIRQLREFRRGITLGGPSVREMIEEGRQR